MVESKAIAFFRNVRLSIRFGVMPLLMKFFFPVALVEMVLCIFTDFICDCFDASNHPTSSIDALSSPSAAIISVAAGAATDDFTSWPNIPTPESNNSAISAITLLLILKLFAVNVFMVACLLQAKTTSALPAEENFPITYTKTRLNKEFNKSHVLRRFSMSFVEAKLQKPAKSDVISRFLWHHASHLRLGQPLLHIDHRFASGRFQAKKNRPKAAL